MSNISDMTDEELAAWQAGWQEHTGNFILAEREWERRMISHEFSLQKQLADASRKWLVISAIIGVIGTLAGTLLGASLQENKIPSQTPKIETHNK